MSSVCDSTGTWLLCTWHESAMWNMTDSVYLGLWVRVFGTVTYLGHDSSVCDSLRTWLIFVWHESMMCNMTDSVFLGLWVYVFLSFVRDTTHLYGTLMMTQWYVTWLNQITSLIHICVHIFRFFACTQRHATTKTAVHINMYVNVCLCVHVKPRTCFWLNSRYQTPSRRMNGKTLQWYGMTFEVHSFIIWDGYD